MSVHKESHLLSDRDKPNINPLYKSILVQFIRKYAMIELA